MLRWTGGLATGLALPALLATQSRWAWLGGAASIAVGVTLLATTRLHRRVLLAGFVVVAVVMAVLSSKVLTRSQYHALIWRDTAEMIAAHPWGVGPGQFQVAFLPFASNDLLSIYPRSSVIINDAHCEPLQVLAELGWLGLVAVVAWLAMLALACLRGIRKASQSDEQRPYLVAMVAALSGSAVQSLGSPDLRFIISSMVFATLAGLAAAMDSSTLPTRRIRLPGRIALAGVGLLSIGWAGHFVIEHARVVKLLEPRVPVAQAPSDAAPLRQLLQAVKEDPNNAEIHYNIGIALAGAHSYHEAAIAFRKAATLSSGKPAVIRSLGLMEGLAGEFEAALPHLRASLISYPDDAEVRYLLAYSAFGLGDVATAIQELEVLLAAHPDHPQGLLLLQRLRE